MNVCPYSIAPNPRIQSDLALPGVHGNLVPDAQLAVVEHGLTLYSTDADFGRFQEPRWINPIAA
jgi:hypothetical protein